MCGIFGLIHKEQNAVTSQQVESGLALLQHRGPDAKGIFLDQQFGIGNCRLAIIDPDPRSNQPFQYLHYIISYNGAIYNYKEIRNELTAKGYGFRTESDTEVILAAYDFWGKDCVLQFNGMWAFVIYDQREKLAFCSRDRFGIKPFYYWQNHQCFVFCSEIKAFHAVPEYNARLNETKAFEYLVFGMQDQDDECLFEGVKKLPAGYNLIYDLTTHKVQLESYYSFTSHHPLQLGFEEAKNQFYSLFQSAVKLRLRGDVHIGSCFSGGLDSSSIVAMILEGGNPIDLATISAQFDQLPKNEIPFINEFALSGQFHSHIIQPDFEELMATVDTVIYHQDEPFSSFSVLAQHLVFKNASSLDMKVMLDGQGGDELLGGYDIFWRVYFNNIAKRAPLHLPYSLIQVFINNEIGLSTLLSGWKRLRNKQNPQKVDWLKLEHEPVKSSLAAPQTFAEQSMQLIKGMGLPVLLHYEDRNAMAHGVESRLPFLDHRLVEFCLSLPNEMKIYKGIRKHILREAMQNIIPRSIYLRKDKMGFETPQDFWMKEHHAYFKNELSDAMSNLDFISGPIPRNPNTQWRIILFSKWMKKFGIGF